MEYMIIPIPTNPITEFTIFSTDCKQLLTQLPILPPPWPPTSNEHRRSPSSQHEATKLKSTANPVEQQINKSTPVSTEVSCGSGERNRLSCRNHFNPLHRPVRSAKKQWRASLLPADFDVKLDFTSKIFYPISHPPALPHSFHYLCRTHIKETKPGDGSGGRARARERIKWITCWEVSGVDSIERRRFGRDVSAVECGGNFLFVHSSSLDHVSNV